MGGATKPYREVFTGGCRQGCPATGRIPEHDAFVNALRRDLMNLKKTLVAIAAVATFSTAAVAEKLSVAATPVPHAELLEFVKPTLAEQGVELDVKVF